MSGHTKGPWSIPHFADENSSCACSYIFSDAQRGFGAIATIEFGGENENYETAKANANLIAAAPDLLEALEDLLCHAEYLEEFIESERGRGRSAESLYEAGEMDDRMIGAKKAIAKSRGEA